MSDGFYRRWILANAWAEGLGLGSTLLFGVLAGRYLESRPGPAAVVLGALGAVLLGTVLEGVVVGIAQGRVLRGRIPSSSSTSPSSRPASTPTCSPSPRSSRPGAPRTLCGEERTRGP